MAERRVTHCYRDPLSEVWLAAACKIGLRVARSDEAFAHSDGRGTLSIANDEHLDADDCLAQMIFHELCHSLVEGPEAFELEDWGLDNSGPRDEVREHATLRLQALLAGRHGLRAVLAPTTDFRAFYDALPADPLSPRDEDSSILAVLALRRAATNPWWPHLGRALQSTAAIVEATAAWAAPSEAPVLYRLRQDPLPLHPGGPFCRGPGLPDRCGQCAWRDPEGHCRQIDQEIDAELLACERFELPFDCRDCGACCRAAYHSVTLAEDDEVAKRHPELVVHRESYSEMRREDDHCAALVEEGGRFHCEIYEDRPTCCREFENAGPHCLTARRRLGLSL